MNHKILIIDCHPVYAQKIRGFLMGLTFKNITIAATGRDGVAEVREGNPDLVILSGMLPDMESHDICREVKHLRPETGIIVQTGLFTSDEDIEKFKTCGADNILSRKEKDLNPLRKAIERLFCLSAA